MSNELMRITVSELKEMAIPMAKCNLFGFKTPEEAFSLMLIAQAEGLHPALAARDYHVIQGKPSLKADAMLARFQKAGGTVKWARYDDEGASGEFSHPQGGSVLVEWTIEMAKDAGLTNNPTWKKYPRAMLRSRCISEGIRTVFPGVIVGFYTEEEVESFSPIENKKSSRKAADIDVEYKAIEPEPKIIVDLSPQDIIINSFREEALKIHALGKKASENNQEDVLRVLETDWYKLCNKYMMDKESFEVPLNIAEKIHELFGLGKPISIKQGEIDYGDGLPAWNISEMLRAEGEYGER